MAMQLHTCILWCIKLVTSYPFSRSVANLRIWNDLLSCVFDVFLYSIKWHVNCLHVENANQLRKILQKSFNTHAHIAFITYTLHLVVDWNKLDEVASWTSRRVPNAWFCCFFLLFHLISSFVFDSNRFDFEKSKNTSKKEEKRTRRARAREREKNTQSTTTETKSNRIKKFSIYYYELRKEVEWKVYSANEKLEKRTSEKSIQN